MTVFPDGKILLVPACEAGRGGGHLMRCLSLLRELRAFGRDARLFTPAGADIDRFLNAAGFDSSWRITESGLTAYSWDCIILDRFKTSAAEFDRWAALAPLVGMDEGGCCRERFDFLIDILPGLYALKPNIASPALLPLYPKEELAHNAKRITEGESFKILVSFGHEDSAGLGMAVVRPFAKAMPLGAENRGVLDITLLSGLLNPAASETQAQNTALPGIRIVKNIPNLGKHLAEYDLVITHYGITAFEALYAQTPVLLVSPATLHEKLAKKAGFCSMGKGTRRAARTASLLLLKKNGKIEINRNFLQTLKTRCAALAKQFGLDNEGVHDHESGQVRKNKQSFAALVNSFTPLVKRSCPVCGAAVGAAKCFGRGPERSFRRCMRCGLIFMNRLNKPPVEYSREYFFEFYQKQYGKTYIEDFPNLTAMAKRRLAAITPLLAASRHNITIPALLDIGCAYGPFLAAAKEAGFSPLGIDPAEDAVRYVNSALGIKAVAGFFPPEKKDAPDGSFDVVSLWYVIEHFCDCVPVFAEIRRILRKDGVLAFATPSFSGISGRASRERFLSQSPADHWTIWSPGMCRKALALAGFRVKKIVPSGHHPERFPLFGKFAADRKGALYALLLGISKLFRLGDTFEVYALKN